MIKPNTFIAGITLTIMLLACEQQVVVEESRLTGINPLSYTAVTYKGVRDTVLVAKFDGSIAEVINGSEGARTRSIIDLQDEVYSLAYHPQQKLMFAATLNRGVVVVDETKAAVVREMPLREKWIPELCYNARAGLLGATDYGKNAYLWEVGNDFKLREIPEALSSMQIRAISDSGTAYFNLGGKIGKWNTYSRDDYQLSELSGRVAAVNTAGLVLVLSYAEFAVIDAALDSVISRNKHPNWPIYVEEQDTTVAVPLSLPLTDAVLTDHFVYTAGIDRSVRVWEVSTGRLTGDLLGHGGTISAMALSQDQSQLVSVDLKGEIKFWELGE